MKRCEHCGAEHKSSVACGWFKDKPDWMLQQGFDPPCSMDEYDEEMRALHRRRGLEATLIVVAVVLFTFWVFNTFGGG